MRGLLAARGAILPRCDVDGAMEPSAPPRNELSLRAPTR